MHFYGPVTKDAQIQYLVIQEKVVSTLLLFHILGKRKKVSVTKSSLWQTWNIAEIKTS